MKVLIRTTLLLTFAAFCFSTTYACQCEVMSPRKKLREAKVVFVGQVLEIGQTDDPGLVDVPVKFRVERRWKGVKNLYVTVWGLPRLHEACGLPVKLNEKYLIYAFKEGRQLFSSFCVSRDLDHAKEDFLVLGKGKAFKFKS